jgi:hypothetical protein
MAVILLTYGNIKFYKAQKISKQAALANGVDEVVMLDDKWLRSQTDFYDKNRIILDQPRGAGYWLWKPYAILETLKRINDNDILFYLDSGAEITGNISPLVSIAKKNDIVLFKSHGHLNTPWTKRDCFYYMDCDDINYHRGAQTLAGFMLLKKTAKNIKFIEEWLKYSCDSRIITDAENVCGLANFDDFIDHRHDLSILSLLAIKHKMELFRDPCQFGDILSNNGLKDPAELIITDYNSKCFTNSPYGVLIDAHRSKYPMLFTDYLQYYLLHKEYKNMAKFFAVKAIGFLKRKWSFNKD